MKFFERSRLFALPVFALFLLGGCVKSNSSPVPGADDVILIGEVDSMTGPEATFGIDTYRGITLAIDLANANGGVKGKKLRLISSDVQGRPDEGARAISKLITQDKVVAVLTGTTSSNALAMAPLAQHHQIPMVASAATAPKLTTLGDYIFRVCFIDPFQGATLARFAATNLKAKTVAIMRDVKSDYSVGLADEFLKVFKANGGVGIEAPLLGGDGWDSPKLKEIGGDALVGSYFLNFYTADDPSLHVKGFITAFQSKFNEIPDGSAAMGFEAANFLINGLKNAKTLSSKDIREALGATRDLPTLNGKMSVDSYRNAVKPAVILKINKDTGPQYFATVNP
ncbi:MAG: ABC transporter substrate-binding protein [Bdellovibrio sp.]|nr:ABC transporter substrate-binding protein [Bdellovibrio sp.]